MISTALSDLFFNYGHPINGDDFFVVIKNITHVDSEYTDFELEVN